MNLLDTFSEFKDLKNIDRATLIRILEDAFRAVLVKQYGTDQNFSIIINTDKGDFEILRKRIVVDDDKVEDSNLQISLSEAKLIDKDFELGEEVTDEVKMADFGRRHILGLRQSLSGSIMELERDAIYQLYKDRIGQIVVGEVYQVWKREVLVRDDDGNDLILPKSEQIPSDFFRKGDTLRAVVVRVEVKNNSPLIILSRTSPMFLQRLFEAEVPEIYDGLITIHKIVRMPGERAKVAVESYDDRIDPVGACVGMKGSRIHSIVRELHNESIDVINYTTNTQLYIQRALSPAKINSMNINEAEKRAEVYLDHEEVSMAIGKGGSNIKLAIQLVGYEIDVFREPAMGDDEDVLLDEFVDDS
ncbi:MAG: transcription termination factor NusA, partial [Bacteroidales bacterium]|nr:transcription termination factor NusA [Bacteroidales bacterium]